MRGREIEEVREGVRKTRRNAVAALNARREERIAEDIGYRGIVV